MELKEYLRIIFAHRKVIIFLTLVTVVVATIGGFSKQTVYEATTTVLIKSDILRPTASSRGVGFISEQNIQRRGKTFGQILKSRAIAEKVVNILGVDKILGKKKLQKHKPSMIVSKMKDITSTIRGFKSYLLYGKVKKQRSVPRLKLIERVQKSISASLLLNTSMIKITILFQDAQLAADIANEAASVFVNHMKDMNSVEARIAKEFIAKRVKVAVIGLKGAQDTFRQFIIKEGSVYPEHKTTLALAEFVRFESSLKNTKVKIDQIGITIDNIHQQMTDFDRTIKASTTTIVNPLIQELKSKLVNLEIQRSNLSVDYGPLHPRRLAVEKEIEKIKISLKAKVKRIVQEEVTIVNPLYQRLASDLVFKETDLKGHQSRKKAISQIIKDFPQELKKWAEKQIQWDTLTGRVTFAQTNLNSLKLQLEAARIKEAQKISEIAVIDMATPPLIPKGLPKIVYSLLGLIVGIMGGIGIAFFLEYIDDSVKTVETIEEELKLSVFGVIPEIKLQGKTRGKIRRSTSGLKETSLLEERLITHFEPKSPITEAYRSFRTNIQFAGINEKNKIFLITSSLKGEGKTTTIANLAITTAQLGNKTILIDADMRNPMVYSIFGKGIEPGLSNYLGGSDNLNQIIIPSGIENLDIISSGPIPPNPAELLSSKRLDELIDNIKESYNFILIDSPPILAVTDSVVLSSKRIGVFLVIQGGITSKRICLRAKALLENVNANILGAVLNKVKVEGRYGYEYYYQYYYG